MWRGRPRSSPSRGNASYRRSYYTTPDGATEITRQTSLPGAGCNLDHRRREGLRRGLASCEIAGLLPDQPRAGEVGFGRGRGDLHGPDGGGLERGIEPDGGFHRRRDQVGHRLARGDPRLPGQILTERADDVREHGDGRLAVGVVEARVVGEAAQQRGEAVLDRLRL